jgi:hypothetical protein
MNQTVIVEKCSACKGHGWVDIDIYEGTMVWT